MNNRGEDVGTCQWPTVVRAGYSCSGVYIGNGLVLTAAHCLDGHSKLPGGKVWFGESISSTTNEIEVEQAIPHPDGERSTNVWGEASYKGVDLAICILKEPWPGPVAPVMHLGCESNWLNYAFFNLEGPARPRMRAVSVGCNEVNYNAFPPCVSSGRKRVWAATLDRQWPQTQYLGSTKLTHLVPPWIDDDPMEQGDSGSPLFVQMPDGTWRVIGIFHGEVFSKKLYWEPVPPFVAWIEEVTGRSIAKLPGPGFMGNQDAEGAWSDNCGGVGTDGILCGGGLLLPPPPTEAAAKAPPRQVESFVIEGNFEVQRFAARVCVEEERLDVRWRQGGSTNPLQLIADAVASNASLRREGIGAVVEGSWLRTNGRMTFESLELTGGRIRRGDLRDDDPRAPDHTAGWFLTGHWDDAAAPVGACS